MAPEVSVTIHGCRGSFPVGGKEFNRYGGATSCVVVSIGGRDIVFDAGSGIIDYGRDLLMRSIQKKEPITNTLFFSHLHFDHLIGLPYFPPIFHPASTLYLYGPRPSRFDSFEETIESLVQSPFYPVALHEMHAVKFFGDIGEAEVIYFTRGDKTPIKVRSGHPAHQSLIPSPEDIEAEVHCMRGFNHPKLGVNIYKIIAEGRTIVYATDTEGYVHGDQRLAEFARGADLLIHDAMYTEDHYTALPVPTQGYGHSTVQIATNLASMAEVKQLCLFHHDPKSTDDSLDRVAEEAKSYFENSVVARDGLVISL